MKRKVVAFLSMLLATGLVFTSTSFTSLAAENLNPYTTIEAEASAELKDAMISPKKDSVVIKTNGYVVAKNVDFSKGIAALIIKAGATNPNKLEIRVDKADGEVLAGAMVSGAVAERTVKVSKSLEGVHDLYFVTVRDGGSVQFDSWSALSAPGKQDPIDNPPVENPPIDNPPVDNPPVETTTVNPYETVEAEASAELKDAMISPKKDSVVIKTNGYVVAKNVDFSKGVAALNIKAGATNPNRLEIRVDKADGEVLAGAMVSGAVTERTVKVSKSLEGVHDLYFVTVKDGGSVQLDSWTALSAPEKEDPIDNPPIDNPPVDNPPVETTTVNPYETVEAEASAELKDAMVSPKKDSVVIKTNGYVVAKNVDFSKGVKALLIKAGATKPNKLEIRVDKADGEVLAGAMVSGEVTERTVQVASNLEGVHDLYFVAVRDGSSVQFDSWKALSAPEKEDPIDNPPIDNPPIDNPPIDNPPIDNPPVDKTELTASYDLSSWNTGYTANFKITNKSGKTVDGWKLKLKKSEVKIDSSWCVKVEESGDYYVITPLDWNKTIENGREITFGFVGSGKAPSTISYSFE